MTEMLELSKQQNFQLKSNILLEDYQSMAVMLILPPHRNIRLYSAGPAQFGLNLKTNYGIYGHLILADPIDGCSAYKFTNQTKRSDKILVAKRGNCMFVSKARLAQQYGFLGLIIVDNSDETSYSTSAFFAMSGDGTQNIHIPSVFLFGKEGNDLINNMQGHGDLIAFIGDNTVKNEMNGAERALTFNTDQVRLIVKPDSTPKFNNTSSYLDHYRRVFIKSFNARSSNINVCLKSDYQELKCIYDVFNLKVKGIMEIDEAIHLNILTNNRKEFVVDIDILKSQYVKAQPDKMATIQEYTNTIYEMVRERLEEVTNLKSLSNYHKYTKTLYNFVNYKINPSQVAFRQQDQIILDEFSNELNFNFK